MADTLQIIRHRRRQRHSLRLARRCDLFPVSAGAPWSWLSGGYRASLTHASQAAADAKGTLRQIRKAIDPREVAGGYAGLTAGEMVGGAVGGVAGAAVGGPEGRLWAPRWALSQ